jgi:hypothetical protein
LNSTAVAADGGRLPPRRPSTVGVAFVDASGHLRGVRAQHLPLRYGDEILGVLILAFDVRQPPSAPIGVEPQPQLTPASARS